MPQQGKTAILFVEDNANTAMTVRVALGLRGYEVDTAASIADASAALAQKKYEVLVTDLNLPDGSGEELLQVVQGTMNVIVLSGYCAPEDIARSKQQGFFEHLPKPFDLGKLCEVINEAISIER